MVVQAHVHLSGSGAVKFTEKQSLPGPELQLAPVYGYGQGTAHE